MADKAAGGRKLAVYAGSFDPMTLGHFDVISRAGRLFDEILIAVGRSNVKTPFFTTRERVAMINEVCKPLENAKAVAFDGLVAEFANTVDAVALVRGLRTEDDFTYEMQMAMMNRGLDKSLETIFIPTSQMYSHISSTLVKEVASYGGDVGSMVPPLVVKKLAEKFNK